jgi:hypothetical protein
MSTPKRVLVTPTDGLRVRDPAAPQRHIAATGEVLLWTPALQRLADAGDVRIEAEPTTDGALPLPTPAPRAPASNKKG